MDTFGTPHTAELTLSPLATPARLTLALRLDNRDRVPVAQVVGQKDFRYAVLQVHTGRTVLEPRDEEFGLLAGLSVNVKAGEWGTAASTVIALTGPPARALAPGRYVGFGALNTDTGVIVARPLPFRLTQRGELVVESLQVGSN